jgi:hypothetical protein
VKTGSKSLQKLELGSIADRIASGIGSNGELEADDRAPSPEVCDGNELEETPLKAPQSAVRRSRCRRRSPQAESSADSCPPVLGSKSHDCLAGTPSSTIDRPLASSHASDDGAARYARNFLILT